MHNRFLSFVLSLAFTATAALADRVPQVKIQVFSMHLDRISKITLSSVGEGDTYIELDPGNYDHTTDPPPPIVLGGSEFSTSLESFLLEVDFSNGTQIRVPLRVMRPIKDRVKEVRLAGREIDPSAYADAIDSAISLFSNRKAYEPFSLCSNYYQHAADHPSFAISAAVCWVKANRLMVLATKPPFRHFFGADKEAISTARTIIEKIDNEAIWQTAHGRSYYPNITMPDLESDLRHVELSEWRLFAPGRFAQLDNIYGPGSTCSAFQYYAMLAKELSNDDVKIIQSPAIGVKQADYDLLLSAQDEFNSIAQCVVNQPS